MKQSLRLLTLDQIRAFVAVCEHGSFTNAAKDQSRTQTAVTRQIRAAEDILGEKLFHRCRGHFEGPTEAGEKLLPFAIKILATLEDAWMCLERPGLKGTIRVGVMDDIDMNWLLELVSRFKALHPDCDVTVISDFSTRLEKRLEQRELDVAIVKTLVRRLGQADVHNAHKTLRCEPLLWAAGAGFRLRPREPLPLVLFHEGCVYRHHVIQRLESAGVPFRIAYEGQSYGHLRAAVAAGLGVTALAESQVAMGGLQSLVEVAGTRLDPLSDVEIAMKALHTRKNQALSGFMREVMQSTKQDRLAFCTSDNRDMIKLQELELA
ncbi:LysR substrate-binding domain-containing protein [Agrobacterium vitis]|uniref:LysR substrate-binding domain-containing protein n=1 Tax=Agrobacterium vitis TaxID=373 RepID=UPI001574DEE2|nr:LysR substrate-binding domain-containing protein [Agrobacterium vitis]NSZ17775.1 LysR family transcriptional regulator [Agrobacterium vitis]QZO03449.1 LysR family transcriptional regulator [Agrobacterium vitis]UJL88572.1 LysR family transcriptional regulator [Agrobacterium vitis]